jgi:hypothetical protein
VFDLKKKIIVLLILISLVVPVHGGYLYSHENNNPIIKIYTHNTIELFHVVAFLSNVDDYSNCQFLTSVFLYQAKQYFSPWKNHKSVHLYKTLKKNDLLPFVYQLILYDEPWEERICSLNLQNEDQQSILQFEIALQEFSNVSNFSSFLTQMKDAYKQVSTTFQHKDLIQNELQDTYDFFGYNYQTVHVILCPTRLYAMEVYDVMDLKSRQSDLFLLVSLSNVQNGYLQFGSKEDYVELLSENAPDYLFLHALQCFDLKLQDIALRTNETFCNQIVEAIRIATYGEKYTTIPVEDYFDQCNRRGQKFVFQIYTTINKEYTSNRVDLVDFIMYTPKFYHSVMKCFQEGEV